MLRHLWESSIWHPDAIDPDEFKFRSLKRVWLPVYDLIATGGGLWALSFGSPLLHALFVDGDLIDTMGAVMAISGLACFFGVAFPRLYGLEIVAKLVLLITLASYAVTLLVHGGTFTAAFAIWVVALAFPLPIFRLGLLGEEIKERRDEGKAQ